MNEKSIDWLTEYTGTNVMVFDIYHREKVAKGNYEYDFGGCGFTIYDDAEVGVESVGWCGEPICNDCHFLPKCVMPISTYFVVAVQEICSVYEKDGIPIIFIEKGESK